MRKVLNTNNNNNNNNKNNNNNNNTTIKQNIQLKEDCKKTADGVYNILKHTSNIL